MNYKGINEHAVKTACFFAYKLTSSIWFKSYEREDITQELILEFLINEKKYNSSKGKLETFINIIMRNKARKFLEERKSLKNHSKDVFPINDEIDFEKQDYEKNLEDICDINKIMGFLDEYEKALCLCIMQGMSINQVIKKFEIGKSKFYRIMNKIKNKINLI